jgi:hypothetical protein
VAASAAILYRVLEHLPALLKLVTDRTFTCDHVQTGQRSVCHQLSSPAFLSPAFLRLARCSRHWLRRHADSSDAPVMTPTNPGTTPGAYTITVTGTSGGVTQSTAVTVAVN